MSQEHPGNGNDHQDPDMAAMLSRIRPPQHGDDFWATLRSELHVAAGAGTAADDTGEGKGPGSTVVPMDATGNGRGSPPGRDWRRWTLLAAAAVVVVALIGGGYLALRDGETEVITPPDPTLPDTTPDTSPTTTTIPDDNATTTMPAAPGSAGITPAGEPIDRGPGRVIAVDPTSRFVYIADAAPEGGQGCEGAPRGALYVEPIDGGERTLIADAETIDATTPVKMRFDGEGGVAVVTQCEGFGATVYTSTIQGDGTFAEITELTIPDGDLGRDVDAIIDIEFREPGVLVAVTSTITDDGSPHRHLYEFPVEPGEVKDLGVNDALWIAADPEGRLAIYNLDGQLRYEANDQVRYDVTGVNDIRISPSGALLAVTGEQETAVVDLATGDTHGIGVTGFAISYIDESVIIFERFDQGLATAVAFNPDDMGGEPVELVNGEPFGIVVAPDLSRVFATQASDDDTSGNIVEQRLAR